MPLFCVVLHGQGFPGVILGKSGPIGFYTTRYVEASSAQDAEGMALAVLREAPELDVPAEHRTKDAKVLVEDIVCVPASTERVPNAGFTFYLGEE